MLRSVCSVCGPTPPATSSSVSGSAPSMPATNTWSSTMVAWQNAGSRTRPATLTFRTLDMACSLLGPGERLGLFVLGPDLRLAAFEEEALQRRAGTGERADRAADRPVAVRAAA